MNDKEQRTSLVEVIASFFAGILAALLLRWWRRERTPVTSASPTEVMPRETPPAGTTPPDGIGDGHSGVPHEPGGPIPEQVIGSFAEEHTAAQAIASVRERWRHKFDAYSPFLSEEFMEAMGLHNSPVRYWVLTGAIIGQGGGWATTIMLSIYWRHPVANMPVIAVPPFTIVGFELMVLLGALFGVAGLFFHCRMPNFRESPPHLRRFKQDRIGIVLDCPAASDVRDAELLLRELGAEEIIYA
jgi:hypothetical protein